MRPQVRNFRNIAAQVCQDRSFPFAKLMGAFGLEDVLNDAEENNWPAKDIAGQVLFRCCVEDGRFNNCMVGLLSVITFLNEQLGKLGQGQEQAFRDLVAILQNQCTLAAIDSWLNTHYP